tara:strand:+ start:759 stop:929 length:171 start_codon:yes stop_codon:yes gene_type:complete
MLKGIYLMILLMGSTTLLILSLDQMIGYVPLGALLIFTITLTTIYYSLTQIMKEFK